jgi:hypothetical protein
LIRYSSACGYIYLSWHNIPVLVVPVRIFLIGIAANNKATEPKIPLG